MPDPDTTTTPEAGGSPPASAVQDPYDRDDPPAFQLTLWPHRSLSIDGFRQVLIFVAAALAIPLIPFLGTPVAWGLLPFLVGALIALYAAIRRSYRDGELREELRIWPDLITVVRTEPKGGVHRWHANPYWVTVRIHDRARIENYLTLKGNGREIELGAFLSPEERLTLRDDLDRALHALPRP
ncbi:DUF2244 domain-containing protein [Halovulum dunhuangense]|uniref:DUF2244 domain-containing protein n=1 Tax=Halovulum dunhuangense TaxID=1505036 RepID=A0A849L3M9_9RHOB|nr:DUF2244 domain-containing protein [Halovulum dunhuangense]NNU80929.1 DUF2244 domain-containing protein [Halovulum dunhuangense]